MSYLDSVRFVVTGDRAKAMSYVSYARKMLFDLARQGADSGVITARSQRTLPDGTKIEVSIDKLQATARIDVTGGRVLVGRTLVYVTKAGVIRTYDLEKKKLLGEITGLPPTYVINDGTIGGEIIYLTSITFNGSAVIRVDVQALSAFAANFTVNTPAGEDDALVPGTAYGVDNIRLSPDGKLAVVHFSGSGVPEGDFVEWSEGVGGGLLVDAETLQPLRPAIRMSFLPMPIAWKPDSSRFYLSTSINYDNGDVPNTEVDESWDDYISVFDAAGVFLGSRHIIHWGDPVDLDGGWSRSLKSIVVSPNGERLYVTVDYDIMHPENGQQLFVLDITDDSMPIVAHIVLVPSAGEAAYLTEMLINHAGSRLAIHYGRDEPDAAIAEFDITDDVPVLLHETVSPDFDTRTGVLRGEVVDALQNAPKDSMPPFEGKRFFMSYTTTYENPGRTLRAYSTFDAPPTYEFDFEAEPIDAEYLVFAERPQEKPDDRKRIK